MAISGLKKKKSITIMETTYDMQSIYYSHSESVQYNVHHMYLFVDLISHIHDHQSYSILVLIHY